LSSAGDRDSSLGALERAEGLGAERVLLESWRGRVNARQSLGAEASAPQERRSP
jgi:hypothetical protein